MSQPKTAKPLPWNWPVIFVIALFAALSGMGYFYYCWKTASPFENSADVAIVENNAASFSLKKLDNPIDHLQVDVEIKEDGKPSVTYTLPSTGNRPVPRFFLEQDKNTQTWNLVFVSPKPAKGKEANAKSLHSSWVQTSQNEQQVPGIVAEDSTYGPRMEIELPVGNVEIKKLKVLPAADLEKKKNEEIKVSAEHFENMLKSDHASYLRLVAQLNQSSLVGTAHHVGLLKQGEVEKNLANIVRDSGLFLSLTPTAGDNLRSREIVPFSFSGSDLKWIGSLGYFEPRVKSVPVKVKIVNVPSRYEFWSYATTPSPETIAKIRLELVNQFVENHGKEDWPPQKWLFNENQASLGPVLLIPVVQSCRHHVNIKGNRHEEIDVLSEKILNALTADKIGTIRQRLGKIKEESSKDYHYTYLYCEYVVCLVHIHELARKVVPLPSGYSAAELSSIIMDGATVISNNIAEDGTFYNYLPPRHDNRMDRSIAQVGLYSLQYVLLAFQNSGDDRITNLRSKLSKLAGHLEKLTGGVAYQGNAPFSPHLLPGSFQAAIAQIQLGEITPAEFATVLKQLDAYFQSRGFPSEIGSWQDSYRWMYWARVYELLIRLSNDPKYAAFFPDGAICPALNTALKEMSANITSHINANEKMLADVALGNYSSEAVKRTMLLIALESIWETLEIPDPSK